MTTMAAEPTPDDIEELARLIEDKRIDLAFNEKQIETLLRALRHYAEVRRDDLGHRLTQDDEGPVPDTTNEGGC
jgi:hypothetical protein